MPVFGVVAPGKSGCKLSPGTVFRATELTFEPAPADAPPLAVSAAAAAEGGAGAAGKSPPIPASPAAPEGAGAARVALLGN